LLEEAAEDKGSRRCGVLNLIHALLIRRNGPLHELVQHLLHGFAHHVCEHCTHAHARARTHTHDITYEYNTETHMHTHTLPRRARAPCHCPVAWPLLVLASDPLARPCKFVRNHRLWSLTAQHAREGGWWSHWWKCALVKVSGETREDLTLQATYSLHYALYSFDFPCTALATSSIVMIDALIKLIKGNRFFRQTRSANPKISLYLIAGSLGLSTACSLFAPLSTACSR